MQIFEDLPVQAGSCIMVLFPVESGHLPLFEIDICGKDLLYD